MSSPGSFCTSVLKSSDAVRQPDSHVGAEQMDVPGSIWWIEVLARDPSIARATMSRAPGLGGHMGFVHTVPKHGRVGSIFDPGGAFLALRGPVPTTS